MGIDFCDGVGRRADEHEFGSDERSDGVGVLETVALGEKFLARRRDGGRLFEGLFENENGRVAGDGDGDGLSPKAHVERYHLLLEIFCPLALSHPRQLPRWRWVLT